MIHSFDNNFITIIKKIYKEKYNFNNELNYFHEILDSKLINKNEKQICLEIKELGISDRNSIFYDDYHYYVDNNTLFNEIYYKFIEKHVKPFYGNKIIVQKTPNLRISFPNTTAIGKNKNETINDIIGIHKDSDFGHHEDEINFIIPITEMFETNSLYYEPYPCSNEKHENYINLKLKTNEYFIGKFNTLLHFNRINKTESTRISMDFRIIPYESYFKNLDYFKNTKFELDKYFIIT